MKDKLKKNIVKKTLPNESDKMSRRDFLSLSAMGLLRSPFSRAGKLTA